MINTAGGDDDGVDVLTVAAWSLTVGVGKVADGRRRRESLLDRQVPCSHLHVPRRVKSQDTELTFVPTPVSEDTRRSLGDEGGQGEGEETKAKGFLSLTSPEHGSTAGICLDDGYISLHLTLA